MTDTTAERLERITAELARLRELALLPPAYWVRLDRKGLEPIQISSAPADTGELGSEE